MAQAASRITKKELRKKLKSAYHGLRDEYRRTGGWRYYGRPNATDPQSYLGPTFWSETDVTFRMALELETEFSRQVHMEMALNTSTLHDFDPKLDAKQYIDIVVSDFSSFRPDAESNARFARHVHEAFVEVKHFRKGWWPMDRKRAFDSVKRDIERLAAHVERGHCRVAGMLVFDDEDYFTGQLAEIDWPRTVERYLLNTRVARQGGSVSQESPRQDDAPMMRAVSPRIGT
jgi:hypothetical protein